METNKHTAGKLLIDGSYIVGGIFDLGNYEGKEGVIIADFRPSTEYPTPSKDEQLANAERIVNNWNEYEEGIKERHLLIDSLKNINGHLETELNETKKYLGNDRGELSHMSDPHETKSFTRGKQAAFCIAHDRIKELLNNIKP